MSSKPAQRVQAEALDLPPEDRARIAYRLLKSLDEDGSEDPAVVARAWDEEIVRRVNEYRAGNAKVTPASEVLSEARQRSKKG